MAHGTAAKAAPQRREEEEEEAGPSTSSRQQQQFRSLGLRLVPGSPMVCSVYLKPHVAAAKPGGGEDGAAAASNHHNNSTVYVVGLPLGVEAPHLQAIFGVFGGVATAVLHQSKRSALVVFDEPAGAARALALAGTGQVVEYELPLVAAGGTDADDDNAPIGLKAWVAEHKAARPGNAALQAALDSWVAEHEEAEAEAQRAREAEMAGDGWTVVVRSKGRKRAREAGGGGVKAVSGGVALAVATAVAEEAEAKRLERNKKEPGFYRFEAREARRSELLSLRDKFEAGRKRVAELRAARRFKPS